MKAHFLALYFQITPIPYVKVLIFSKWTLTLSLFLSCIGLTMNFSLKGSKSYSTALKILISYE